MKKSLPGHCFVLAILVVGFYCASYFLPMWDFEFVSPQYPQGLNIQIYLNGARGDVFEIDIINHYIGMAKLGAAAPLERKLAPYCLILFAAATLFLVLFPKSILAKLASLPGIVFPLGFILTFFIWLYRFGHELDPSAAVNLPPFTPTIFGPGIVGNFKTWAYPTLGFWSSCMASILSSIIHVAINKLK